MRIAYVMNQYPKISHTFIRNEILALERAGFDVLRISIRGWEAELLEPVDRTEQAATAYLLKNGLAPLIIAFFNCLIKRPVRTLKALALSIRMSMGGDRPFPYHFAYLAEACLALRLTREHRSQHVHAHFGSNSTEVAMLLQKLGGPAFSFTAHGPEEFDKASQIKLRKKIEASSFVVGISSFGRSQLFRHCEAQEWSKIKVVHCGLGEDYLEGRVSNIPETPRLICVGRLCEQKGQMLLVRACSILVARGINVEIVLVGDGDMRMQVENLINQLHLQKQMSITGWLDSDAIRALLAHSRGLVLPSFAEGLPVVIMESMAIARPVVSTYIAGIPELVRDGLDGFLVRAGSEDDLADAMERLLKLDKDAIRSMGTRARARVLERHSASNQAEYLGKLFRDSISLIDRSVD
jgi:glycosyltransferase involved in cell wall biosynthesis